MAARRASPQPTGRGEDEVRRLPFGGRHRLRLLHRRAGDATRWIPATGYITDGALQGPAGSAWVKFKSGSSEVTVTVTCQGGRPHFSTAADDRGGGHGGGDGGGGGGSGGGGGGH